MGIREAPDNVSTSDTAGISTWWASIATSPVSPLTSTLTPCSRRRSETTWTSRISGTFFRTDLPGASNAATIALLTRFLAPRTLIVPFSGRPPTTCRTSFSGSTALTVTPYGNSHTVCFNSCRNGVFLDPHLYICGRNGNSSCPHYFYCDIYAVHTS